MVMALTCVALLPATGAAATRTTASSMSTGSSRSSAAFAPTASRQRQPRCVAELAGVAVAGTRAVCCRRSSSREGRTSPGGSYGCVVPCCSMEASTEAEQREVQQRCRIGQSRKLHARADDQTIRRAGHPPAASRLPHHSHQSVCQVFNKVRAERRDVIAVPTAQVRAVGYTEQVQ